MTDKPDPTVEKIMALADAACLLWYEGSTEAAEEPLAEMRAAVEDLARDARRHQWTPASEPPDSERVVLVWCTYPGGSRGFELGAHFPSGWSLSNWGAVADGVLCWRDVEPPKDRA